ncbi:hypothetical protein DFH11DRAFT_511761 [Phellopilus nigrolimitatus]|nr:hypothetical protein DFH11DRAFT_511761 [Phellopilus nigrolimitatus]
MSFRAEYRAPIVCRRPPSLSQPRFWMENAATAVYLMSRPVHGNIASCVAAVGRELSFINASTGTDGVAEPGTPSAADTARFVRSPVGVAGLMLVTGGMARSVPGSGVAAAVEVTVAAAAAGALASSVSERPGAVGTARSELGGTGRSRWN